MNTMMLIGTLTQDPELQNDTKARVCNLRVAESGGRRDAPLYINVRAYGRQAEVCGEYLTRGRQIAIQGQLRCEQTGTPDAPDMRYWIAAERIDFLSKP